MMIADAQVHIWGPETAERPWRPGQAPHRDTPLDAATLLREMAAAGVDRAIVVPPYWDHERNDLVLEAAQRHPDRFAVMGRIDTQDANARRLVASWRRQPGMLGLRLSFNRPRPIAALAGGDLEWLWDAAERAGVPLMLRVSHALAPHVDGIAARHPGLKIVLCHLALTNGERGAAAFRDLDRLLVLARHPGVAVKASALPCYATDGYPCRSLHPYLRRVYDAYGPRRMFWGTDLSRLPLSYREAVTMYTEEMPWLGAQDLEWIMGRGLCAWLDWPLPGEAPRRPGG